MFCASCPAPLGSREWFNPSDSEARSIAFCTSGVAVAASDAIAWVNSIVVRLKIGACWTHDASTSGILFQAAAVNLLRRTNHQARSRRQSRRINL